MKTEFRPESRRIAKLTAKEKKAILNSDSSFYSITKSVYFDNYNLSCPIRVAIETKAGKINVVLRKTRHGDVNLEADLFRVLNEFGLAVPKVLVAPFKNEKGEYVAVYSFLQGENLQKLSMKSGKRLKEAKKLVVEGVFKLMRAGNFIARHKIAKRIPRQTLIQELERLISVKNSWHRERVFKFAIERLRSILEKVKTPLTFSNGDYQPGNFLAKGGKLSGFLDFESPVFQDPLMGFVKYPIYDLFPLGRTNIVDVFLKKAGFSRKDFAPRLALGCLKVLQKEIPVRDGNRHMRAYRARVLRILNRELKTL